LWVKAPPEVRNEEAKHMATAARRRTSTSVSLAQRIAGGIVGGIVGGLVFGAMMAMMGMLPMVASVVGSKSALIGFLYHMFNSAIIGALFGLIFGQLSYAYGKVRSSG
jgi:predicted lipid-binding transport protein (Tim44 family)